VLEQQGFETGGDVWPAIALAEARFPAGPSAAPPLMLHGQAGAPAPPDRFYAGAPARCGFEADEVRRIYFVKRPTFADERRRLDTFGLMAAVQRSGGPPMMTEASGQAVELTPKAWQALLASDPHAPAFGHDPYGAVCTFLGHTETWVLENDTDEVHNFHIHQSEFQLALDKRADPAFFSAPPGRTVDPLLGVSDQAVQAADGEGREAEEAVLYHDTIPVPRGVSLSGRGCDGSPLNPRCRPGRVTIRIRFDRDEQIGDFVYHCHILQHEDDGMMALVRVLCPPSDDACVLRHSGASAADGELITSR
jgi:FtsP/CotA-like multicopper oxidase with cupredoxin domain